MMMIKQDYKEQMCSLFNENSKLKKQVLELTMENAELKDMVLDLGGEYKESSDERTDEWRIKQFNRNRAPEEQVHSIQEMNDRVEDLFSDKWIYE